MFDLLLAIDPQRVYQKADVIYEKRSKKTSFVPDEERLIEPDAKPSRIILIDYDEDNAIRKVDITPNACAPYIGTLVYFWGLESSGQAITIGLIWLLLTVGFEFLFGHFIAGHSWSRLGQDYNLLAGRVWILVLLVITFAPLLFYQLFS